MSSAVLALGLDSNDDQRPLRVDPDGKVVLASASLDALAEATTPVTAGGVTSAVILGAAGTLRGVSAQVAAAVAPGVVWVLVLDAAALPADGVVTSIVLGAAAIDHAVAGLEPASIDFGLAGAACANGAVVVLSTNGWSAGACTLTKIVSGLASVIATVAP